MKISTNSFKLLTANFFSYWGDSLFFFSLSLYVLDTTKDIKMISLLTLITILPKVLFIILGHAFNLRFENKNLIISLDLIAGILFILFSIIEEMANIYVFFTFIFIVNTTEALYRIPSRTIITSIEKGDDIDKYHALNNSLSESINIITPFISIYLYNLNFIGFSGLCLINGVSYIIAAILESRLRVLSEIKSEKEEKESLNVILKKSALLLKQSYFFNIVGLIVAINLTLGAYNVILLQYSVQFTETFYSLTLVAEGIGGALSILFYKLFPKEIIKLPRYFLLIALILFLGIFNTQPLILFMSLLIGLVITIFSTNYFSTILKSYDKKHSGSILATTMSLGLLSMPVGNYIMSFLDKPSQNLFVLSLFSLILFFLFNYFLKKTVHSAIHKSYTMDTRRLE